MKPRFGIIHTGPYTHLDHLAPFAYLLESPLIVSSIEDKEKAALFYPMVEVEYIPLQELSLAYIASSFDALMTCGKFWALELKPLFSLLYHKELRCVFVPHGYSDKETILGHPTEQDIQLVYSSFMNGQCHSAKSLSIGNVRLSFYKKYQAHFDALLQAHLSFSGKPVVLYAPTWSSKASTSSFFSHIDSIANEISSQVDLILKPHPLLEENDPARYVYLIEKYKEKLCLLLDFPAMYPLLEKTDIYLGDSSSIGYDFLYYDRPLFFLSSNQTASFPLEECGLRFEGDIFTSQTEKSALRKARYKDIFGEAASDLFQIKKKLLSLF